MEWQAGFRAGKGALRGCIARLRIRLVVGPIDPRFRTLEQFSGPHRNRAVPKCWWVGEGAGHGGVTMSGEGRYEHNEAPVDAGDLAKSPVANRSLDVPSVCHRLSDQVARPSASCDRAAGGAAADAGRSTPPAGKRHPFVSVMLVACSAVVAGACSFAAIGQWARNAPQDTLARLGARTADCVRVPPRHRARRPSAGSIHRACPGGLADLLGTTRPARNAGRGRQERPRLAPRRPRPRTCWRR